MTTATYCPAHPIVFVFDSANKAMEVPDYDRNEPVSANESCVSIRTISELDGEVTVDLLPELPTDLSSLDYEIFNGSVRIPSGKIAVVTSTNEKLLELNLRSECAYVQVFTDDVVFPSRVRIVAMS